MAPVPWSKIEPYFREAFGDSGDIAREDVINLAFAENESDEVIDTIDAIGSRVFRTLDDARSFLQAQGFISE